ncbi:hypothetical protein Dsin_001622 [Dipteronia sinensis]|uniref:Ubiquitin-like protease family profile domain-containing protein n=1 Tax=Dipteronia sinensis TaxID=43782 RepID=A0AAE0B4R0_9ROSI|nr:hypothetical protein Dsin_001622 [Dipteronia sinensis]
MPTGSGQLLLFGGGGSCFSSLPSPIFIFFLCFLSHQTKKIDEKILSDSREGVGYSKKRERGRKEEKRSRRCRSPSLPLAIVAARTSVAVAAAHRRVEYFLPSLQNERERKRRDRYVAVAIGRHQSHLSLSRSVGVDCPSLECEDLGSFVDIFLKPYAATKDGIHVRYFENDENIRLTDVWARFMAGEFYQPKDGLKMALVLIANNVLFGQDLRRKATLWLFQMVEDLEAFNSFPWGSYVYMMTIHYLRQGFRSANAPLKHIAHYNLYGFPWALEIWAMEAFGSLIDLVGKNLGHRHPRLKNWRIFKRPHDFFGKFAKYEKQVGDDSTDSSRLMREVMSAMSDRFEDIVKKEMKKEISAMEGRLNARLTSVEASLAQLVNQRRQTTLEVHDFSTPVHQHFESHRVQTTPEVQGDYVGSPNVGGDGTVGKGVGEGDATPSEGIVGGDATHSEELQIVVHNSLLQEEMVVQTLPLYEDDTTMLEYIAQTIHVLKEAKKIQCKSLYTLTFFIQSFWFTITCKLKMLTVQHRLNVGTDYYATKQFFVEMESPTCWLSNVAKLREEWKKFQPSEDAPLTGELDALSYKCPTDWLLYASGDKPGWGTCWSSVRYISILLVPCAVGDPDGHWILCVIDLEKRTVCIYDPLHRQKKIATRRKQITLLLRFIPVILQEFGYYQQKGIQPNGTMFTVQQSIPKKLPTQLDNDSCGVFICRYTDMLMRHKCFWGWGTKNVPWFREEMALEIFANSVASD